MKFLDYLDRRAERKQRFKELTLGRERMWERMTPHDFRGWLGLALFLQSTFLFMLLAAFPTLNENQGFLTLASAVIVTGWVGGAAAFAYSAGKSNAETREQMSKVLDLAHRREDGRPAGTPEDPFSVEGADQGHKPVETRPADDPPAEPEVEEPLEEEPAEEAEPEGSARLDDEDTRR